MLCRKLFSDMGLLIQQKKILIFINTFSSQTEEYPPVVKSSDNGNCQ